MKLTTLAAIGTLFALAVPAVGAAAAGATGVPGVASAAAPEYEKDRAVKTSAPTGDFTCTGHVGPEDKGGTACFKHTGDKWYLRDNDADGFSVVVYWYLYDVNHQDVEREGECRHTLGADSPWGLCNKNYPEHRPLGFTICLADKGTNVECKLGGDVLT